VNQRSGKGSSQQGGSGVDQRSGKGSGQQGGSGAGRRSGSGASPKGGSGLRLSGGRRLQSPPGLVARPTAARVRLAVMNLVADQIPGCRWLDLCGGSGVMACEALQRGAALAVAIELDRGVAAVARANLEAVAQERGRVICQDARLWLATGPASDQDRFDLIYLDPPWSAGLHGPLSELVAAGGWLAPGGTLLWECDSTAPPPVPPGWLERRRRRYGGSTVVVLEPTRPLSH
jgi:16S rRNA (guanine(966)-N(2))-methyltransferase RsmD